MGAGFASGTASSVESAVSSCLLFLHGVPAFSRRNARNLERFQIRQVQRQIAPAAARSRTGHFPLHSTAISFAPAGIGEVVVRPPGQRTQIESGFAGSAITTVALSWDQ